MAAPAQGRARTAARADKRGEGRTRATSTARYPRCNEGRGDEGGGFATLGGVKATVALVEALMAAALPDLAGELDRLAATMAEWNPRDLWEDARAGSAAGGPAWAHLARLIAVEHAARGGAEMVIAS